MCFQTLCVLPQEKGGQLLSACVGCFRQKLILSDGLGRQEENQGCPNKKTREDLVAAE